MDWSDEHYVKLYTRDTATWASWPWQARAIFPLLLRKLTGAGLLAAGRLELTRAVAVMISVPEEVVAPAIAALLADGTVEQVGGGLLVPRFLEAQEARKTDKRKSADYRAKARDLAKSAQQLEHPVTLGYNPLPSSPAQPSPAQPKKLAGDKRPPRTRISKPPDPRHTPLVKALCDAVPSYTFDGGRDAKQVALLLAKGTPAEVVTRWRRANERSGFPLVRTLTELVDKWPHFATEDVPPARQLRADPNEGIVRTEHQCSSPDCERCGPINRAVREASS